MIVCVVACSFDALDDILIVQKSGEGGHCGKRSDRLVFSAASAATAERCLCHFGSRDACHGVAEETGR